MLDAAAWLRPAKERLEQLAGTVSVLDVGGQSQHHQNQSHRVHKNVALAPVDFLARVVAALVAHLGALDALAVDARRAGVAFAVLGQAHRLAQMSMNGFPQAVVLPEPEVVIDRAPRSKVFGQVAPLAAGFGEIEDRLEQLPERVLAPPPLLAGLGKTVSDQIPFGVRQVRGITHPQLVRNCSQKYNDDNGKSQGEFSNKL